MSCLPATTSTAFFAAGAATQCRRGRISAPPTTPISACSTTAAKAALYTDAACADPCAGIDSYRAASPPSLFDEARHMDRINQALYLDMQLLLSGNNLVKPDRMGMAVSLEARTPFLDWRMMEFAFRMPGSISSCGTARPNISTRRRCAD
jgi:hypothetical protein